MALTVYKNQASLSFLLFCITLVSMCLVSFATNDFVPFSGSEGVNFAITGCLSICITISMVVNIGAIVPVHK